MPNGELAEVLRHYRKLAGLRSGEDQSDSELLERFAARKDRAAFEAVVRRHGPMVLGVCRRILQDAHEAEDAFQATFLVLVRKAGSIAKPELLGNWLYGVAYRTALKAKAHAARRRRYERQAAQMLVTEPTHDMAWQEIGGVLDEEMNRLPHKYRAPLVLCYLEGKTHETAARLLGWPTGSMSSRLARGRELLRERLTRRGLGCGLLPFGLMLSQNGTQAVPASLVEATVKSALEFAQPTTEVNPLSSRVAGLADEVLGGMRAHKLQMALAVLLVIAGAGMGAGSLASSGQGGGPYDVHYANTGPLTPQDIAGGFCAQKSTQGKH